MLRTDQLHEQKSSDELNEPNAHIVIVGGGPIGLAYAWGLKKLNSKLKVTVLEKYKEYQRDHNLVVQVKALAALMKATNAEADPELAKLLEDIKKDPHIRTNNLETIFKTVAATEGVTIINEEVKDETIHEQLRKYNPSLIIGADGTHSTVNRCLFPPGNLVKVEFDYVLQLRYEVNGAAKAEPINKITFLQDMARHGLIATEYPGRYDEAKGKTPVTMQMMISREAFLKLKEATSKKPIRPFLSEEAREREDKADTGAFQFYR